MPPDADPPASVMDGPVARPDLPDMPARIAGLPIHRGYPVPWFVVWLNDASEPVPAGQGTPDFRILKPGAIATAHNRELCWVCGGPLGVHRAFVIGPMCAVNRTSSEPPSHVDCAEWSAQACPFLARPHMVRRDAGKPETVKPAGIMLERNPGVALIWITRRGAYRPMPAPGGVLFRLGDPERVAWYAHGRTATRAEIEASIDSGLPALCELAVAQGPHAVAYLEREHARALDLLPA